MHFRAQELRTARAAFEAAIAATQDSDSKLYGLVYLALCDYSQGRTEEARDQFYALMDGLPLGHPYREYGQNVVELIDDHAQKEQLIDRFERESAGTIWSPDRSGSLRMRLEDDHIVLDGRFQAEARTSLRRVGALPRAGNFLAVEVRLQVERSGERGFQGLKLEIPGRAGGEPSFQVLYGMRSGAPYLRIWDGRPTSDPKTVEAREPVADLAAQLALFDATAPQVIQLAVEEETKGSFSLVASWNGVEVHRRTTSQLRPASGQELEVELYAEDPSKMPVKVIFDDFKLVRRMQ